MTIDTTIDTIVIVFQIFSNIRYLTDISTNKNSIKLSQKNMLIIIIEFNYNINTLQYLILIKK